MQLTKDGGINILNDGLRCCISLSFCHVLLELPLI